MTRKLTVEYAVVYAVVDKDARFVSRKGRLCVYQTRGMAERRAVWEGDAVVELRVDVNSPPLFIRAKTIRPG